jgi:hypothetical protein
MSRPTSLTSRPAAMRRALAAVVLALTAVAVAAGPAHAGPAGPDVPTTLAPVGDVKPYLVGHAVGWQVHTCAPAGTGYAWRFDGPVATLYDDHGTLLASHSAGPRWTARDGSSVVGELVDKVSVNSGAIPWLLLRAASGTSGPDGSRLAETTHIQRINTTGGLTPAAAECSAGTAGETRYVPYTADYVFWKATGAGAA